MTLKRTGHVLKRSHDLFLSALRWLMHEAWEKIDLVSKWKEIRDLGRRYGPRFILAAVLWEIVEDVVFPLLSWHLGHPELIPVFLVLHFEPLVYPLFFWAFRTWDRIRGRIPWEPNRRGMSTHTRTALIVLSQRLPAIALFFWIFNDLDLPAWLLTAWTFIMLLFGFVHDRIWHDSNFGIEVETDTVNPRRVLAKATTYRATSIVIMASVFYGLLGQIPFEMGLYQAASFFANLLVSAVWARSSLGIIPIDPKNT